MTYKKCQGVGGLAISSAIEDGGVGGWLIRSARRIVGDLKELMLTA